MRVLPSLKKNYILTLFSSFLNFGYPLITLAFLARIVGAENLGKFYFANALVAYFLLGASLGIPIYGSREIAKTRANLEAAAGLFSELFLINLCSSLLAFATLALAAIYIPQLSDHSTVILILSIMLISNIFSVDFAFHGIENYANPAFRAFITKSVSLLLIFLLVGNPDDYLIYAGIVVIAHFGYNLHGFFSLPFRMKLRGLNLGRHFKRILVVFGLALTINTYFNLDSVMLGLMSHPESVALYNVAVKTNKVVVMLLLGIGAVVVPRVSFYLKSGMEREFAALSQKSVGLTYFVALPSMAGIFVLAPAIVQVVFGEEFAQSTLTMRICAPLIILVGLTSFLSVQVLFPIGREKAILYSALVAAISNLGLNLILIPKYANNGAAIATVITELIVLLLLLRVVSKLNLPFTLFGRQALRYFLATTLMVGAVLGCEYALPAGLFSLGICISVGIATYLAILHLARDDIMLEVIAVIKRKIVA